jgi:hypothetical protein
VIPEIDNWIINLGAVVAALGLIGAAIWNWVLKPTYDVTVGDKLDLLAEKLEIVAEDLASQVAKVNEQLTTNGGSSLRDQTNRIEKSLAAHVIGERERSRIMSIELKATNARVEHVSKTCHLERERIHQIHPSANKNEVQSA